MTDGEIPAKWERKRLLVGCAGQGKKGKITTNTYGSCERCGCYNFISRPHALPPPATVGLCYLGRADYLEPCSTSLVLAGAKYREEGS